ncbi:MAG: NADH-quinone oxidoreductase subunit C [Alphaproteobacteria bacterium]|nr:MAG: NADH-quinone oxidoreductase subunit C [Alphaproteobacteria bacterium]
MTTTPHIDTHLDLPGLKAIQTHLEAKFPATTITMAVREVTVECAAADVPAIIKFLRDDKKCQFTQLIDVCGVDYLGAPVSPQPANRRFAVVYHLLSMALNQRIRVKAHMPEDLPAVPSITGLHLSAGWFEREAYDMYGIVFEGHPDLRRILTDADFDGFPLRKDFPLEGHVEVYYDAKEKRVATKPVDLPQELRHFDRVSEWQGMTGNAGLADADNTFTLKDFK